MNTGKLNKRISYTTGATYIDDGFGGKTLSVAGTTVETWCSAEQLSMNQLISYGLPIGNIVYRLMFHYARGANLSRGMNLVYGGKTLKINSILNQDEEKRTVIVLATYQE